MWQLICGALKRNEESIWTATNSGVGEEKLKLIISQVLLYGYLGIK